MTPFVEFRSPWPARTGSWCAAAIMLALSLLVFFVLLPPVLVLPGQPPVSFSLAPLSERTYWRYPHTGARTVRPLASLHSAG